MQNLLFKHFKKIGIFMGVFVVLCSFIPHPQKRNKNIFSFAKGKRKIKCFGTKHFTITNRNS